MFLDDLPLLTGYFGKPVVVGGSTISGILDRRAARLFEDRAPVSAQQFSILCRTADLPALAQGMALTVDGVAFLVNSWEPDAGNPDGLWTRVYLESQ